MSYLNDLFGQSFANQPEYTQHWNIRLHGYRKRTKQRVTPEVICNYLNVHKYACDRATFQKELSKKQYEHWHIHLTTVNDIRLRSWNIKEWLECDMSPDRMAYHQYDEYVEVARSAKASERYASKNRSRVEGPYQWQRGVSLNALPDRVPAAEQQTDILSFFKNP